jgi:hypothetical protein
VDQVHSTYCCPASIMTIINAARTQNQKLDVNDFFTPETEAILSQDIISCNGVTLEIQPRLMNAHGLSDCSFTLASSRESILVSHLFNHLTLRCSGTCSEFRDAAVSSLKNPSSFIIVNFSRRALNQKGYTSLHSKYTFPHSGHPYD